MSEVRRESGEVSIEAPQTQNVLEKKFERNSKADTTPSVLNVEKLIFKNTGAVLVTKFDNGQPNQEISILGDGFTTIQNNANIQTAAGVNTLLVVGLVYRYTYFAGKWHEDAGSAGGGGTAGARGSQGIPGTIFNDYPRVEEPFAIPGLRGTAGGAGIAGAAGKVGPPIPWLEVIPPIEPMMIPGRAGNAGNPGAAGKAGQVIHGIDGRDAAEPMMIPGKAGVAGVAGGAGVAGRAGVTIPGLDGRDAPEPMHMPGTKGSTGLTGAIGKTPAFIPGLDGRDAPEPMMIPGLRGVAGTAGGGGGVTAPFTGNQAPGTFTVADAQFGLHGKRLTLNGVERGIIAGSGRLVVNG